MSQNSSASSSLLMLLRSGSSTKTPTHSDDLYRVFRKGSTDGLSAKTSTSRPSSKQPRIKSILSSGQPSVIDERPVATDKPLPPTPAAPVVKVRKASTVAAVPDEVRRPSQSKRLPPIDTTHQPTGKRLLRTPEPSPEWSPTLGRASVRSSTDSAHNFSMPRRRVYSIELPPRPPPPTGPLPPIPPPDASPVRHFKRRSRASSCGSSLKPNGSRRSERSTSARRTTLSRRQSTEKEELMSPRPSEDRVSRFPAPRRASLETEEL